MELHVVGVVAMGETFLGIDCGSVSLNVCLLDSDSSEPVSLYLRTKGRPLPTLVEALDSLAKAMGEDVRVAGALLTGSGRELLSTALAVPTINEITAHAVGARAVAPEIRTIIEIGGQDSKYIRVEPSDAATPRIPVFRMNEICAAGTGAFLDEQAQRLGIAVEDFGDVALQSLRPAPIAGRCAVFAKTDMIHQAQEGAPLPDILLGLAFALVRNYMAALVKGDPIVPVVSLQGGVMANAAVVHAFRSCLGLKPEEIVIPPHFKNLGAYGCAIIAQDRPLISAHTLGQLKEMAIEAMHKPPARSFFPPLTFTGPRRPLEEAAATSRQWEAPLIMGLDVGSVSVKGVIVDADGAILAQDYRFSMSRPLETLSEVVAALVGGGKRPEVIAITGSGRNLAGRLIGSELIVNEISAQCRAAVHCDPGVDTIIEIGGQDSKWIALDDGKLVDFEMNRVCAAGTGSFLMAQSHRLGLDDPAVFSEAAFAAQAPADLGCRCTVFMESDLIHHQNNGATTNDLAAGVCISIVRNYLERVANNKRLGCKVLFTGGVAANDAVTAAFEQYTGRALEVSPYYRVSGAMGAALIALDKLKQNAIKPAGFREICWEPDAIKRRQFTCNGCSNQCRISRYTVHNRSVASGGLCDRWEVERGEKDSANQDNIFTYRRDLIESALTGRDSSDNVWTMVRSPQFYEYFPFWKRFLGELGISLIAPPRPDRKQFEEGVRGLRVETCLPMKVLAGQIKSVVDTGARVLFHPAILSELPDNGAEKLLDYCPYVQASSQFFKGVFDVQWVEPVINSDIDPDAFRKECLRLAAELGMSRRRAMGAYTQGLAELEQFNSMLRERGRQFLESLGEYEPAVVLLAKPYHAAETFLNMNIGSLFQRLGVKAIPADLYPLSAPTPPPVTWKYQARMIRVAQAIASRPNLFPILIGFFGCGPDSFTLRHVREALSGKPLLCVEMDEHTSRAGLITRIEAFWDQATARGSSRGKRFLSTGADAQAHVPWGDSSPSRDSVGSRKAPGNVKPERIYVPYWGDHVYAFAAAAMSAGIEAAPLPAPDEESERLGRPHTLGGECHPFALVLGDYLKISQQLSEAEAAKSRFYLLNPNACRLGQFPVYIEKIRKNLDLPLKVIQDIDAGLAEFRISPLTHQRILLRLWEGLNAYDLLSRLFWEIRPRVREKEALERSYNECCHKLYESLSQGRVRQGVEEALHELHQFPVDDPAPHPLIVVTGDYYTRVVPFANNDVFQEVEANGGVVLTPPTLSDSFKLGTLRDFVWTLLNGRSRDAARHGLLYLLMTILEFNVRGSKIARNMVRGQLDILGLGMWKTVTRHANTKLPAGITAPFATTLRDLNAGADGVLNLMTLNCSYGTVVTAALMRALKNQPGLPMLTLVYDGLKKTNEKTRIEAFMEQAHDHMARRLNAARLFC
uniref:CoA activase n=1 Tax=Desulfomonile tiedjei TaxID=2358 RepID=A0A7C4ESW8_9BACT